jgi:hypothetical protein
MAVINGPIRGHFENHDFVCDRKVGSIRTYKTGLTGFFWHIVGMFIREYASVGIDVFDTRSNRQYCLYVTPGKAGALAHALAARVLSGSGSPSSVSAARGYADIDQTDKVLNLKHVQAKQLREFEEWAASGQWDRFHSAHYDWWMFPINRPSAGHGEDYNFSEAELESLRRDPEFMASYRRGVELVALSYGWDVQNGVAITGGSPAQCWRGYGVRLGKMADSLRLLQQDDYFANMQTFARQQVRGGLEEWVLRSLGIGS